MHWGRGMTTPIDPRFHPPLPSTLLPGERYLGLRLLSTFLIALGFGATLAVLFEAGSHGRALTAWELTLPGPPLLAGLYWAGILLGSWRTGKVAREVEHGWELLQSGRPGEALHFLETGVHETKPRPRARSLYGLALACFRQGDFARALAYGHMLSRIPSLHTFLPDTRGPALVATVHALRGDLEAARAWGVAIRRPMFDRTDYPLLAQVVILCRNGWYAEAVKRIQGTALHHIPEEDVGAVRVLHAFARSWPEAQRLPLKPGCALPEQNVRASGSGYLAREWPELAAFLQDEDAPTLARSA